MEIQVFDAKGQSVMTKPILREFHKEKPAELGKTSVIALSSSLALNREGDFTLRVIVTDRVTKKKVSFEAPLRVTPL
jgi:hypothetical protein